MSPLPTQQGQTHCLSLTEGNVSKISTFLYKQAVFSTGKEGVDLCVVFFQQANGDMLTKKGDFVFSNDNLVEIVAKVVLAIQSLTGKPPEVQVSPR